ncbi:MAG TPA: iron-containing alcohol dehydrogenase, partial [Candidatus Dormibacteraeota bacterium]|nr:iron-containing alcohol dehydrogenase [Candidatus Dormibacteraeota bacterium]
MVRLIVDAARGSYPVIIGTDVHREVRNLVRRLDPSSAVIVTDSNVRPWAQKVAKAIKPTGVKPSIHVVAAGERSKSLTALTDVLAFFERQKIDRDGLVVAVGGGTVGDLAGFAASVWLR